VPRAGWLAAGGIVAALVATLVSVQAAVLVAGAVVLFAGAVGVVGAADSLTVAETRVGPVLLRRRARFACAAVGTVVVMARIALGVVLFEEPAALTETQAGRWVGQVVSISSPARGEQRAVLDVQRRQDDRATESDRSRDSHDRPVRVYATLPRYPPVAPGDRVAFDGRLEPRPDSPFGEYLAGKGIVATAEVEQIQPAAESRPSVWLERLRRAAADALARTLPEPQAGLAAGILIGLRDRVSRDVADAFTTSGLSHVVAISGWNIAIVGAVVGSLLRGRERGSRSLLVALSIASYTIFAGASPSVVRAALMAATALLARESGRRGAAATALGLAAFAMLVVDPETITDAGYQLSVAATAGLLRWSTPVGELLRGVAPRSPEWLRESLAVSLAAQVATLPLLLLAFGRLSLIAPLANLVVAPLVAPSMLFGLAALAAGVLVGLGAPAILGVALASPGSALLGVIVWAADTAAAVPLASIQLDPPWNLLAAGVAAAGLLVASSRSGTVRRSSAVSAPRTPRTADRHHRAAGLATTIGVAGVLAILSLVVPAFTSAGGARLSMTVLDIGQGDAILLEGPRGGRILVDGGPDPDRLLTVLDARIPAWDRRLDLVVLTHPHEDHVAGLPLLLERYRIAGFAEPGMRGPGPGYRAFAGELQNEHRVDRTLAAGDRLRLDGADITVRWPPRGRVPLEPPDDGKGINNVSIVLDVRYGEKRFLLTGDVEQEIDPQLLLNGIGERPVDVLKVPHHGSGTATTDALLTAVHPRVAIVSAGAGNPYGHPNRRTLDRLSASGARVLRTDRDGSVTVTTEGSDLRVTSSGSRPVASADVLPGPQPVGWSCGLPAAPSVVPTISGWQSPIASSAPPSSSGSDLRNGSSRTSARSPRWPPFWLSRSLEREGATTDAS
jgi:competence protein ComEC